MARKTEVAGSVVREWAKSEDGQAALTAWAAEDESRTVPTVGERGRFSADLLAVFHKHNPGKRYVAKLVPVVKVTGKRQSASGRTVPVTVKTTAPELRAFAVAQGAGKRGRISAEVRAAFAAQPVKV